MTVFIERHNDMAGEFIEGQIQQNDGMLAINDAAKILNQARERADFFYLPKNPSPGLVRRCVAESSSFFVFDTPQGREVGGIVPDRPKNVVPLGQAMFRQALEDEYLEAVNAALISGSLSPLDTRRLLTKFVGKEVDLPEAKLRLLDRHEKELDLLRANPARMLEEKYSQLSKGKEEEKHDNTPLANAMFAGGLGMAAAGFTESHRFEIKANRAQRPEDQGQYKTVSRIFCGAGIVGILTAACAPIAMTETATSQPGNSFPTEQAPFDVSYSGTNLKGEIVKSTGEIPSGISDRAKQAVEKQGLSWDKVTVFGLGLQDSSGNVESPIFAIRKDVDTKPGEAGMYFYTEAGDFAVPLLVPPGTGKEGSGFLVPMASSFNADKTRMRWGLASEDRDGNLELGDANAILFTFELDANGKITKVTYSDPYSKKSFSWLTDNVPDNLKKIHDYAISHSTGGQKATETPTNEVTNTPEPTATVWTSDKWDKSLTGSVELNTGFNADLAFIKETSHVATSEEIRNSAVGTPFVILKQNGEIQLGAEKEEAATASDNGDTVRTPNENPSYKGKALGHGKGEAWATSLEDYLAFALSQRKDGTEITVSFGEYKSGPRAYTGILDVNALEYYSPVIKNIPPHFVIEDAGYNYITPASIGLDPNATIEELIAKLKEVKAHDIIYYPDNASLPVR